MLPQNDALDFLVKLLSVKYEIAFVNKWWLLEEVRGDKKLSKNKILPYQILNNVFQ